MASLSNAHRSFMQGMLSRGAISEEAAMKIYQESLGISSRTQDYSTFISLLNNHLKPLDMELATVRMESTSEKWVGVVNRTSDTASKLATRYTPAQLEFFKRALEHLVVDGNGSADSMSLLHIAATLERKLGHAAAQEFLQTLVSDKWLLEENGIYTAGPRFLLELRPFLREMFGEGYIDDCTSCKDPVVKGDLCSNPECNARLHPYCAAWLAHGRDSFCCPCCRHPWEHSLPSLDADPVSAGPSIVTEEDQAGPIVTRDIAGPSDRGNGGKTRPQAKRSRSSKT